MTTDTTPNTTEEKRHLHDGDHVICKSRHPDGSLRAVVIPKDGPDYEDSFVPATPAEGGMTIVPCPGAAQSGIYDVSSSRGKPPMVNSGAYCEGWEKIFAARKIVVEG